MSRHIPSGTRLSRASASVISAREADDCVVDGSAFEWAGDTHAWTVRATWSALGAWDDAIIARLELHAFDEDGQPLAHCSGRIHPDARHVTE